MRVPEALGAGLVEMGVDHVFGVVGSGNFEVTNALESAGAGFVAARHECGAVCMADGYARVTGRVGVATVHQGPGLTNAATGLTEAAKARTPLLVLAGDTAARLDLPLLAVVYNDSAYGAEVHHFGPHGDPVDIVQFPDSDFAALGRAAGCRGVTVRSGDDLDPVAAWAEQPDGPLVVDAKVTPDVVAGWLEDAFRDH